VTILGAERGGVTTKRWLRRPAGVWAYHLTMPPTCNIDARGKLARLIYGLLTIAAGILVTVFWAIPAGGWLPWTVVGLLLAAGAFGIYEARAGWCVVRAMGFKTRM